MKYYLSVIKFAYSTQLAYPLENFAFVLRKFVALGFLILLWKTISYSNPQAFNFNKILSYFLISESIQDLTLVAGYRFGRDIQKLIKRGEFSNYLIRPESVRGTLFGLFAGERITSFVYALITIFIGIYLYPPKSLALVGLFLVCLIFTSILGFGVNILIASIGFYSPEGGSIRDIVIFISKILSGSLIPLSYFPLGIRNIVSYLPFPVLVYFPISILQEDYITSGVFTKLGMSAFWAISFLVVSNFVWKKALKSYDSVGI